jgi:hypothetical protein
MVKWFRTKSIWRANTTKNNLTERVVRGDGVLITLNDLWPESTLGRRNPRVECSAPMAVVSGVLCHVAIDRQYGIPEFSLSQR